MLVSTFTAHTEQCLWIQTHRTLWAARQISCVNVPVIQKQIRLNHSQVLTHNKEESLGRLVFHAGHRAAGTDFRLRTETSSSAAQLGDLRLNADVGWGKPTRIAAAETTPRAMIKRPKSRSSFDSPALSMTTSKDKSPSPGKRIQRVFPAHN